MRNLTSDEVGAWLHDCSDEEFAEAMVYFYKYQTSAYGTCEGITLTKEDMQTFSLAGFLNLVMNSLKQIIFSKECNSSAWWKN